MTTKKCIKCNQLKPLLEFYKHVTGKDGYMCKCKECVRVYSASYRLKNKRKASERNRIYREANKEKIKKYQETYTKTESYKLSNNKATAKYAEKNKIKKNAHKLLNDAIRRMEIIRPSICDECGNSGRIHGHHDDYAKPLDVRWLCTSCHNEWHKENGEAKNG